MGNDLIASDRSLDHAKTIYVDLFHMRLRHDREQRDILDAMGDIELSRLIDDARLFGQTNCGWYQYEAMHRAAAEAGAILRSRAAFRRETATPTPA